MAKVFLKLTGLGVTQTWLKSHSPLPTDVALSSVDGSAMNLSFLRRRMDTTALLLPKGQLVP